MAGGPHLSYVGLLSFPAVLRRHTPLSRVLPGSEQTALEPPRKTVSWGPGEDSSSWNTSPCAHAGYLLPPQGNSFCPQTHPSGRWGGSRSSSNDGLRVPACSVAQLCSTLCPRGLKPTRLLCPWDSPGKNTGVGCHFLLQEIFLTQGTNQCLLH